MKAIAYVISIATIPTLFSALILFSIWGEFGIVGKVISTAATFFAALGIMQMEKERVKILRDEQYRKDR